MKNIIWGIIFLVSPFLLSCEDFVEIDPPINELIGETVYTNDETATAAIRGIYRELARTGFASGLTSGFTVLGGLYADELDAYLTVISWGFYTNELLPQEPNIYSNWESMYQTIYRANAMIEGMANSTEITPEMKNLLEGEARTLRAFSYFYLVNLWGEVPLITNTDFEKNRLASRKSKSQVYDLIINDLKKARELLPEDYSQAGEGRVRINKGVVTALMARVSLYLEDWNNAEIYATEIIENPLYSLEEDLNHVFLKNSREVIWQLKPVLSGHTNEGHTFILTASPSFVALTEHMINDFETGDNRKTNWIESYTNGTSTWAYPFKYKVKQESDPANATEYSVVLRLAEQYLIRAEARAQLNNITGAQEDINTIRNRSGLENTMPTTQTLLLSTIMQERRVELFTEWGHRWLDLKRTGRADDVLGHIKPRWQSTAILWPIPEPERVRNPNLTQNEGY